ncbi:MAG: hypothetical protein IT430_19935 [Phycisphaerales bacterium]|nr:hypothetical protein [Phycisphaerales bacterium]
MPPIATVLVLLAVLLPGLLYFGLAIREHRFVVSIRDFFPLTRYVSASAYSRSTVTAGISLATVILALVNLAPFLGISLLTTIGSYAAGFIVLYFAAPAILARNPENKTLQSFLGHEYGNRRVRSVSVAFTFIGYVAIFSMELLVGVTILEPFVGDWVLAFSVTYLLFIIGYSLISGYRSIVATEQWQFRFIVVAVLMLPVFLFILIWRSPQTVGIGKITSEIFGSWNAGWAFVLGIIAMNLPAAISDSGTWQRLCSTRSVDHARRGLLSAIPFFVLLWGTLIIVSCYIAKVAVAGHSFDPATGSLMAFILTSLAANGTLGLLVLFVFMLGLCAAMITTADSLLLVAAQMLVLDVMGVQPDTVSPDRGIRVSRITLAITAVVSFVVFVAFRLLQFDVVQLIFAIYGAQLALVPAVAAALFLHRRLELRKAGTAAALSVLAGFSGAWGSAIYGKTSGQTAWMYNAPAIALGGAVLVFAVATLPAWRAFRRPGLPDRPESRELGPSLGSEDVG